MKQMILILFLVLPCSLFAAEDYYSFSNLQQQQRFEQLTDHLRCLVCPNQNLSSSNAPLAVDLRNQIYAKVQQGQSDKQIIDYLISRYGHFILYNPPFNVATYGLWFGPFIILIIGIASLLFFIKRKKHD